MSLGEAIATARRARGLTQADLADDLGITQAALSRYENELRQPTDGDLERIARISESYQNCCAEPTGWKERSPPGLICDDGRPLNRPRGVALKPN